MGDNVDVVVIGMGPGGEHAATLLADAGLSVVGIEANLVGGECPYWGCIPSKMMIRASNLLAEGRRISGIAGTAEIRADWSLVSSRIRDEATDNWNDAVAVARFEKHGGRLVRGKGRLVSTDTVAVGDQEFTATRAIVIATGSAPFIPPIEGLAGTPYWTNRDAIECKELPQSLAILGGGPIGVELGQVFARFGVKITIIEGGPRLLGNDEPESSALIAEVFSGENIGVVTDCKASSIRYDGTQFTVSGPTSSSVNITAERLLVAVGRRVDLAAIGGDVLGLDASAHSFTVDDHLRVAPKVWAVGDATGVGAFTHISMYQSRIAVDDILGRPVIGADYDALPRVTFADPEIGSVGLSEARARQQGVNVKVGMSRIPDSTRGWIHKAGNEGFIKLIADADRGVLVGATSAGPTGGEVLAALVVAVHEATPITHLKEIIYAYPTFHRAIEAALADLDVNKPF